MTKPTTWLPGLQDDWTALADMRTRYVQRVCDTVADRVSKARRHGIPTDVTFEATTEMWDGGVSVEVVQPALTNHDEHYDAVGKLNDTKFAAVGDSVGDGLTDILQEAARHLVFDVGLRPAAAAHVLNRNLPS